MSAIRDFFKKIKSEQKFKTAGPGHKLSGSGQKSTHAGSSQQMSAQPVRQQLSEGAQRAGAAALARIEQKQAPNWSLQATKAQAKKELEQENAVKVKQPALTRKEIVQDGCPTLTVSGVYFKCPLIGPEVLPKHEIKQRIKEFLYEQLEHEPGLTACLIIHTVNDDKKKVNVGVETLARYLTNILDNPDEAKYRRIRFNNKAFQERIIVLDGALEFLTAAGFNRRIEENEEYFIFEESDFANLDLLQMLKEALLSAEPILPQLDRNLKVLKPAEAAAQINLPNDFFSLSADEVKREQEAKTEAVELMTQLRTKAMRERDNIRELHTYKFTLVRIRFPDNLILQGTFYVYERLSAVKEFVTENLCEPDRDFNLLLPGGIKLTENLSLLELKLVPAVVLNFTWCNGSTSDSPNFMKPDIIALLSEL